MTTYFMDGQFVKQDQVSVSIDDRGYYFGDGVYEVIKVYDGELYTANEHLDRLFQSASKIKMTIPYTEMQLVDMAKELVVANAITTGHIYMQVTRGVANRVHQFPEAGVGAVVTAYAVSNPRPLAGMANGVAVKSVADIRWLRCDIKSLNLLGNVLAKQEAFESDCKEALLHRDGIVTEGSSSNLFAVKDGTIYTHPANNLILNGITRQVVLGLCKEAGIDLVEQPFSLEQAYEMDELFMTSTTTEVTPVTSIDGRPVGTGVPGPITKKLQVAFALQIPTVVAGE